LPFLHYLVYPSKGGQDKKRKIMNQVNNRSWNLCSSPKGLFNLIASRAWISWYLFFYGPGLTFTNGQSNPIQLWIGNKDSLPVELVSRNNPETKHREYYYLPNQLRVSNNLENQPELLFMAWGIGSGSDQALMHWILTWGLNAEQEEGLQKKLVSQIDSTGILMGSVQVQPAVQEIKIVGQNDTMIQLLLKNLTGGGTIPNSPGGKSASAFKFSGAAALTMLEANKNINKWKQVFIEMPFQYNHPEGGLKSITLRLEVKTLFQQLLNCKSCIKLI